MVVRSAPETTEEGLERPAPLQHLNFPALVHRLLRLRRNKAPDPEVELLLGLLHHFGCGVAKSEAEALTCYETAAGAGSPEANWILGAVYAYGLGREPDHLIAAKYLAAAAEAGHTQAQVVWAHLLIERRDARPDWAGALHWYLQAASAGSVSAQRHAGILYARGNGTERNLPDATFWWELAAEQGDVAAQRLLGQELCKGAPGGGPEYAQGLRWLRRAAERGCEASQVELAVRYRRGDGGYADATESLAWWMMAAARNPEHNVAQRFLAAKLTAEQCAAAEARFRELSTVAGRNRPGQVWSHRRTGRQVRLAPDQYPQLCAEFAGSGALALGEVMQAVWERLEARPNFYGGTERASAPEPAADSPARPAALAGAAEVVGTLAVEDAEAATLAEDAGAAEPAEVAEAVAPEEAEAAAVAEDLATLAEEVEAATSAEDAGVVEVAEVAGAAVPEEALEAAAPEEAEAAAVAEDLATLAEEVEAATSAEDAGAVEVAEVAGAAVPEEALEAAAPEDLAASAEDAEEAPLAQVAEASVPEEALELAAPKKAEPAVPAAPVPESTPAPQVVEAPVIAPTAVVAIETESRAGAPAVQGGVPPPSGNGAAGEVAAKAGDRNGAGGVKKPQSQGRERLLDSASDPFIWFLCTLLREWK